MGGCLYLIDAYYFGIRLFCTFFSQLVQAMVRSQRLVKEPSALIYYLKNGSLLSGLFLLGRCYQTFFTLPCVFLDVLHHMLIFGEARIFCGPFHCGRQEEPPAHQKYALLTLKYKCMKFAYLVRALCSQVAFVGFKVERVPNIEVIVSQQQQQRKLVMV